MLYALVRLGLVTQVIVADEEFLPTIQNKYDYIVDVTGRDQPSAGDSYYSDTDEFINNADILSVLEANMEADYMKQGSADSIEPFRISRYSVSYAEALVTIGCKKYSAPGLLEALHRVLVDREKTVAVFTAQGAGPTHGKFGITWEDAQLLYDKLVQLKHT